MVPEPTSPSAPLLSGAGDRSLAVVDPDARVIAYAAMDDLYASIEIRDSPWLQGKPVIIGGLSKRGVVNALSPQAKDFGVEIGMTIRNARELCPDGVYLKTRINHYKEVARRLRLIMDSFTERVEERAMGEYYLDLTATAEGADGAAMGEIARRLKSLIMEKQGLTASVGVAHCKIVARLASEAHRPNGLTVITADQAPGFLAPLTIDQVAEFGAPICEGLRQMGIERLEQIPDTPQTVFQRVFGAFGARIHEFARGIDPRPVGSEREIKSLSVEKTFDTPTQDATLLRQTLTHHAEALAVRLAAKGRQARAVMLKFRTADYRSQTRSVTSDSYFQSADIIDRLALDLMEKAENTTAIRTIGLSVTQFRQEDQAAQLTLFDKDAFPE